MLSEERIKKMIRLSDYENGSGSTDLKRIRYGKMDYVRLQMIKTFFAVLLAGMLAVLLLVLYHADYIMQHMPKLPYALYMTVGGGILLVLEGTAEAVTWRMASRQYEESGVRAREYYVTLQELLELYDTEEQEE